MSECLHVARVLLVLGVCSLSLARVAAEQGAGLSDPTRPKGWRAPDSTLLAAPAQDAGRLRLQGIFSMGGRHSALLGGRRIEVGDQVAGGQVIGIDRDKVVLRIDGERVELVSALPAVKSPAETGVGAK